MCVHFMLCECVCEGMCRGIQGNGGEITNMCWGQEEGGIKGGWVEKHFWWVVARFDGCFTLSDRILNVVRHWVEFHYYDFERDPQLLEKLKSFVSTVKSKNMQKWLASIHRTLQKVCNPSSLQACMRNVTCISVCGVSFLGLPRLQLLIAFGMQKQREKT